jgi:hypothetical protein
MGELVDTALGLFRGNLQPLAPPDPLDPLVVDDPARPAQQLGDFPIAVAAILPGKLDDVGGQPLLIVAASWDLALRRAMRLARTSHSKRTTKANFRPRMLGLPRHQTPAYPE